MTSRVQRIEIRNFKAFRKFELELEGRHLLIYGPNGSGKSSLYWALYTFLQSARKATSEVDKYFDPSNSENLLNLDEQKLATPTVGQIALYLRDVGTLADTVYRIAQDVHETHQKPTILKGDLASDFITYRFLFLFSNFRNSQPFDFWPLFEDQILPFCVSTSGVVPLEAWNRIRDGIANPNKHAGPAGRDAYATFHRNAALFAGILAEIVDAISSEAQKFYDKHFAQADGASKIDLALGVQRPPSSSGNNQWTFQFEVPIIEFGIRINGVRVNKPHVFLNEAKLTQLGLSVRLAASRVNLHESDIKLLVLDDLLVSLDMSNRMRVVDILLSADFAEYQKIILTHDRGFFQEFRRVIGTSSPEWGYYEIRDPSTVVACKSELETAQDYLERGLIAECGNQLRKHVESSLTSFLDQARLKKGLDHLVDREAFASLHHKLSEASSELSLGGYKEFAELLQTQFSPEQLTDLTSADDLDPSKFAAASKEEKKAKGKLIAKLYASRPNLHQCILDLLSEASRKRLNALNLIDEVKRIKDRILNPASHAGTTPLYSKEAEDAIKVLHALDQALTIALATL